MECAPMPKSLRAVEIVTVKPATTSKRHISIIIKNVELPILGIMINICLLDVVAGFTVTI